MNYLNTLPNPQVKMEPDVVDSFQAFQAEAWPEADLGPVVKYGRGSTLLTIPEEWQQCFT